MAGLTAIFSLVDRMSAKMDAIADSGNAMANSLDKTGPAINDAMESAESSVKNVTAALASCSDYGKNMANAFDESGEVISSALSNAEMSADNFSSAMNSYAAAANDVSDSTDYWTSAVENYDKSALEAIYSTEELVAMGFKSAEALEEQERMFRLCEQSADYLSKSIEATTGITDNLSTTLDNAASVTEKIADNDKISAEVKDQLATASNAAAEAMDNLTSAQKEADEAMKNYDAVMQSGTSDLAALEAAAERAGHAAENLAEANEKATTATENCDTAIASASAAIEESIGAAERGAAAMEEFRAIISAQENELSYLQEAYMGVIRLQGENSEEAEKLKKEIDSLSGTLEGNQKELEKLEKQTGKTGESGIEAVEGVASALAGAGITATVKEIAENVYGLATAFSEAESTIVLATGATDTALKGLTDSMMNAYSVSKTGTLDETAAAVGEINTRLGYTDDKLTETTGLFLDFAAVTGGSASKSVRSVTQLMNQWNIDASNMESVLSKLTYAGQASGISVDALSSQLINNKAVLDQLGFSIDEATAMFMNFELAGTNASQVMTGFRTALSSGAISSLDELYDTFEKIASGGMTAAEASEIFGSRAGPAIVNAAKSGVFALDDFINALENADGTLEKTAETAQTLDQKWEQANNNISAAFTKAVEPALNSASSMLAGVVNGIGNFLNENQLLTKILVSVGAGLAVVVTGIAAVTLVTKVVIPLITTLAGSLSAAQMAAMGLAGAAVAVVSFLAMASDSTAAFEEEAQAIENLNAELDNLEARHNEITGSYNKTNAEIDEQFDSAQRLINRLRELDAASEKTAGSEMEMKAVVDKLNEAYPQLGVTLSDVSNNLDDVIAKFEKAANADSRSAKYENAKARYAQLITETDALKKAYDDAFAEARRANAEYANFNMGDAWTELWGGRSERTKWFEDANAASDRAYKLYMDNMNAIKECQQIMEEYGSIVEGTSEEQIDAYDAVQIAIDKVKDASAELITKYNESYQSAYDSISGTIGLFDQMAISCETSTDQMLAALKSQSDYIATYTENLKTAADIGLNEGLIAALSDGSDESAGYLDAIISKVEELGGTTDEAKKFIDEMNSSFSDVEKAKDEFATTVADMQTNFDTEMEKITQTLEDTITKMNMDEEAAEAAKETLDAYVEMIKSYKGKAGDAAAQVAEATSSALMIALWNDTGSNDTTFVGDGSVRDFKILDQMYGPQQVDLRPSAVPAHAAGTTNAENMFIAGEEGPELIVGKAGSTVFPHDETENIMNSIAEANGFASKLQTAFSWITDKLSNAIGSISNFGNNPLTSSNESRTGQMYISSDNDSVSGSRYANYANEDNPRKIVLEINGSGAIDVGNGNSKDSILKVLTENLKPVLLNLIETEITEEGEMAYDY